VKDNYWIEIKCPTVKGKKYRTIAFRGTREQAKMLAQSVKNKLHDKGHVNVSVKIFKVDEMFLIERF
jgi:hypothetical protein